MTSATPWLRTSIDNPANRPSTIDERGDASSTARSAKRSTEMRSARNNISDMTMVLSTSVGTASAPASTTPQAAGGENARRRRAKTTSSAAAAASSTAFKILNAITFAGNEGIARQTSDSTAG